MSTPVDRLASIDELRQQLRQQPNCRFLTAERYEELLVSKHVLRRCDVPDARLMGLQDPASGERYLVEEERMFIEPAVSPS